MLSGRRLDLLDPSPMDIEIEDIAHGLARVARWNGQTIGDHGFSVAQHSLVVEEIAAHIKPDLEPRWRLAALLHDATRICDRRHDQPVQGGAGGELQGFRG
jgi:5'-deoxynucleotidase YfbR-like HD superfamily hydrolase